MTFLSRTSFSTSARRTSCTGLLVAIVALAASPAAAAPSPRDSAAAEQLFEKGRTALAAEDWATAENSFERSQALDPAVGTLLNLSECRMRLGARAAAWQDFTEALRELPASDPRREYARSRQRELEKTLAILTVTMRAGAPTDARVLKDGAELAPAALGVPLPVAAGTAVVRVVAPGHAEARFTVEARAGGAVELKVAPGPAETTSTSAPGGTRTIGVVVLGVGAAGLVTGIVTGALALGRASSYRTDCPNQACANASALSTAELDSSAAKNLSYASTAGFIVGAAGAGLGLYLVLRRPAASDTGASSLVLSPTAGGGVVGLRGTF